MAVQWLYLLLIATILEQSSTTATHACSSMEHDSVRLYNPDGNASTTGGILQVCTSETWKAVCYYTFDCINEGRAACRQLGYGGANLRAALMINTIRYGSWDHSNPSYHYCDRSPGKNYTDCPVYRHSYCTRPQLIGLWCLTVPPIVSQCTDGSVRLVGGETHREGRLEYCYHGAWSQFCNTFNLEEATVACKQLGFTNSPEALNFTDGRFEISSNFSLFSSISCSKDAREDTLDSCTINDDCAIRCSTFYGISCYEPNVDNCTEGSMRLVNSTFQNEGRIEACRNGRWGPVCGVGLGGAYIVCRALGLNAAPFQVNSNSKYGDSTRPFSYGIERCYGWESSISDCKLKSHAVCFRSQAAGVICRDGCNDGAVRLTGGRHAAEGNIEVCYDQTWRMVSSLRWIPSNTNVVCRQLGYTSRGAISRTNSPFGDPRRSILYSKVQCVGSETKLTDCLSNQVSYEIGKTLLPNVNLAAVSCIPTSS